MPFKESSKHRQSTITVVHKFKVFEQFLSWCGTGAFGWNSHVCGSFLLSRERNGEEKNKRLKTSFSISFLTSPSRNGKKRDPRYQTAAIFSGAHRLCTCYLHDSQTHSSVPRVFSQWKFHMKWSGDSSFVNVIIQQFHECSHCSSLISGFTW